MAMLIQEWTKDNPVEAVALGPRERGAVTLGKGQRSAAPFVIALAAGVGGIVAASHELRLHGLRPALTVADKIRDAPRVRVGSASAPGRAVVHLDRRGQQLE